MKKILVNLVVFLSILFSVTVFAKEPGNLDLHKGQMRLYHDSGEYERDIAKVTQSAKKYLAARLQQHQAAPKKLAIVSDIDETAISGYQHLVERDFGGSYAAIMESLHKGDSTVIPEVLDFYNFAKRNQVAVFFISGRPQNMLHVTAENLMAAGYARWDGLLLRPEDYNKTYKSITFFKTQMRKQLEDEGYDVVINIGDQESDLKGGYADKTFKLPDPFYYIP